MLNHSPLKVTHPMKSPPIGTSRAAMQKPRFLNRCLAAFCLALCLCASVANAAFVRVGPFTNSVAPLEADTNDVIVVAVSGPVANANGSFTTKGLPIRVHLSADGSFTNQLAQNNYMVSNKFMGEPIVFRVPLDSGPTVYSMYDLRISGFNTFVTIGGSGVNTNAPTFNNVTNALGGLPLFTTNAPALTNGFVDQRITNASATITYAQTLTNGLIALTDATNVSSAFTVTSSNLLYSDYTTKIAIVSALGLTNAYATNTAGVSYSGGRVYISTNYDGLGTALAIGLAGTNYTLTASNSLFALHSLSLTNIFPTNTAGISYAGGRAYVSTNYDSLGSALAIGSAGTNYTLTASNSLFALHALSLTNAFATNAPGITYSSGRAYISTNYDSLGAARNSTNGFSAIVFTDTNTVAYTNMLLPLAEVTNIANSVAGSGINAVTGTNINNASSGVIATNGANLTYKFSSSGTNVIQGLSQTISDTSSNLLQAKVNTTSNLLSSANLSASNTLAVLKMAATNGFSTNQIISHGYGTNGFAIQDGDIRAVIDVPSSSLKVFTVSSNSYIRLSVVNDNGGTGDIEGPQGQAFEFNTGGEVAMQDSGGERVILSPVGGVIIEDDENHILMLDTNAGNFTLTGGGSFVGLGTGIIGKINSTNGFAKGLVSTNTALEGSVSFGLTGQATNIVSSTNYLYFVGAGSGILTNGAFIWSSAQNLYTNWLTGCVLTNNTSAWLAQTNGVSLYSLSTASPIGAYSAVNGALPAPAAYYTAARNDHVVDLGFLSVTNLNAMFNGIAANSGSNAIPINNGFGTNTTIYNPIFGFTSVVGGTNNSKGAGAWDMLLGGFANASPNSSVGIIIVGGTNNQVINAGNPGTFSTIVGGTGQRMGSDYGFIGGGSFITITNRAAYSVIPGGNNNFIGGPTTGTLEGSTIGGGENNAIFASGTGNAQYSVIPGGVSNSVYAPYGFAAGHNVTISNANSFAWSDGTPLVTSTNSQFVIAGTNGLNVLVGGITVTNVNPGAALVALGLTSGGQLTTNAVPGGSGGTGSVTSVNVAQQGFSSSGAVTTSGTITLTRNADVDNKGFAQTNLSNLQVTNNANLGGQTFANGLILTNGFTNQTLTASTLMMANANKKVTSVANGAGALTNDAAGNFGFVPLLDASQLTSNKWVATDANTNLISVDAPSGGGTSPMVLSNILIQATNEIVWDLKKVQHLTLQFNTNLNKLTITNAWAITNASAGIAQLDTWEDTNGTWRILSTNVIGGLIRTYGGWIRGTNASQYDTLTLKVDGTPTNILGRWDTNAQPVISFTNILSAGGGGGGGFALVSDTAKAGTSGDTTTTAIDTTGAKLLVAYLDWSGGTPTTFSDNKGNTWTAITNTDFGGSNPKAAGYYCIGGTVGSGHTFTSTVTGTSGNLHVYAFSDSGTPSAIVISDSSRSDVSAQSSANWSSTATKPGSISVASGDLLISCAVWDVATTTVSNDSSFTMPFSPSFNTFGLQTGYKIASGSSSINVGWSGLNNADAISQVIKFTP